MANVVEWLKGVGVFTILTLLTYFAYDNIIVGILDWATATSSILGAFGWVGFVCLYIVCCPLYMFYCFIAGSKDEETHPGWILAGYSAFFLFLIVATTINLVFAGPSGATGLIDGLASATSNITGDLDEVAKISWLAVFVTIAGCIAAPFGMILKGYGKLDGIKKGKNM